MLWQYFIAFGWLAASVVVKGSLIYTQGRGAVKPTAYRQIFDRESFGKNIEEAGEHTEHR